ncbi:hypothetical protein LTR78_007579 [Recurvomyces mirabilis]|uniref:Uncharacterized protein n=1 Tax=Recurvomyces mirabilis TaxID=574656 RepID=A0AAE0WHC5_9PEZI|nr:hypothetical protein LTR78_007579 [Recurvomyces mirabilis]KAK5159909.1 hypothetical protein LTS14_002015 [Recurvomyces mirabilis]
MQFKNLAVSAFVATAFAAPQAGGVSSSADIVLIYQVLQTALPSSLIAEAMTNPAAASSEIAAEFSTATPTWFTALPTDIQTYLVPLATGGSLANVTGAANMTAIASSAIGNSTAVSAGQSSILASLSAQNSSVVAGATTGTSSGAGSTGSVTGASASRSASGSAGASSSSAAGAVPTAIVGMGLAGAVGIVGLFAL